MIVPLFTPSPIVQAPPSLTYQAPPSLTYQAPPESTFVPSSETWGLFGGKMSYEMFRTMVNTSLPINPILIYWLNNGTRDEHNFHDRSLLIFLSRKIDHRALMEINGETFRLMIDKCFYLCTAYLAEQNPALDSELHVGLYQMITSDEPWHVSELLKVILPRGVLPPQPGQYQEISYLLGRYQFCTASILADNGYPKIFSEKYLNPIYPGNRELFNYLQREGYTIICS